MTTNIGPDPVIWVNRLMDVNEGSQFTPWQKATVAAQLMRLIGILEERDPQGNKRQTCTLPSSSPSERKEE